MSFLNARVGSPKQGLSGTQTLTQAIAAVADPAGN